MYQPEVTLFRAVIFQAFLDASAKAVSRARARLERDEARRFLRGDSLELRAVCAAAEIDWRKVNAEAAHRARHGWPLKRTAIGKTQDVLA